MAVGAHGDQVAVELGGLLDGVVGRLAAPDHGAHGKAAALKARRHPIEHRLGVFDFVGHGVASVKVGDAQQDDLGVEGLGQGDHVIEHGVVDRRAVEGNEDPPEESHRRCPFGKKVW